MALEGRVDPPLSPRNFRSYGVQYRYNYNKAVSLTAGILAANQFKGPGLQGLFFRLAFMMKPGIEKRGSTADDKPLSAIKNTRGDLYAVD